MSYSSAAFVEDLSLERYEMARDAVDQDHYLFENAFQNPGNDIARIWTNSPCLVVPRSWTNRQHITQASARSQARGWPIVYRTSGGSCVPHGPGVVNVSMIRAERRDEALSTQASYQSITDSVGKALKQFGLISTVGTVEKSICDGDWNICVETLKFGGTAQRRGTRNGLSVTLTHASLFVGDIMPGLVAANKFLNDLGRAVFDPNVHYRLSQTSGISQAEFVTGLKRVFCEDPDIAWKLAI